MKAPNEKLIETLFIYHALRHLESAGGTVYTPSSREEYEKGYDAKLMNASGFDELYLQFKTPRLLTDDEGYSFETYRHQHERLQYYPIDTAYYLTHLFRSVEQVQEAQRGATSPLDFLEYYVAIEIRRLGKVQRFRYIGDTAARRAFHILYKLRTDPPRQHPKRWLDPQGWMTGAELLLRFERNEVGARIVLSETDKVEIAEQGERWDPDRVFPMSPERAREMVRGDEKTDWGFALRKNVQPLLWDNGANR